MIEVPEPIARPGQLIIANNCSVISSGTERMAIELARKSLLGKARERPDHVKRVLEKMKNEGIFSTISQVFEKLDEPMSLGYSSAGIVLACGAGVQGVRPGDRVASNGPHAGVVCVPRNLCALVPDNVSFEQAAYSVLAAIALQGVRLAHLSLGETAIVIGLGLVGQMAIALLKASGVRAMGTDPDGWKCDLAVRMGAVDAHPDLTSKEAATFTHGLGADAVLIAASTEANGPVELAAEIVRKKGRVVALGAVGLRLPRRPFYFKEAEVVVSCSYGPGRYDPDYEERGHDYPPEYVRWTEQRNLQAVIDLMAAGRVDLTPLTTHRFSIEKAEEAYSLIASKTSPYLGIVLEYPEVLADKLRHRLEFQVDKPSVDVGVGCLGAGNFARLVLLPIIRKTSGLHLRVLCSPSGLAASHAAEKNGFDAVTTDEEMLFSDPRISAVFIASRHDQHAAQVLRALGAKKHVFVEKPLALTEKELAEIDGARRLAPGLLMVGFNRRFSPAACEVKDFFASVKEPLTISVRFNAGSIAPDHWTQNEIQGGGRIIGEACHAIDLATFLAGSPPVRVFAESIGGSAAPQITDDQSFITLRHANGSISSVAYLAGGDKSYPKERVEILGGGRIAIIDDFRQVITSFGGKTRKSGSWVQEKGYRGEIEVFVQRLSTGGSSPISWEDLRAVSLAAILAARSVREGIPFDIQ